MFTHSGLGTETVKPNYRIQVGSFQRSSRDAPLAICNADYIGASFAARLSVDA